MISNSEKILNSLRNGGNLNLTQIQKLTSIKHKPVVLYHLTRMVNDGKIIRNGKNYCFFKEEGSQFIDLPYYADNNDTFKENGKPEYFIPVPNGKLKDKPENLFLFKISEKSMEPTLKEGSILIFKWLKDEKPLDNDILLCLVSGTNEQLKVKRFKDIKHYNLLLSDNKETYDPIRIDNKNCQFIGKMVNTLR